MRRRGQQVGLLAAMIAAGWLNGAGGVPLNQLQNPGFEKDNGYGQAEGWWYEGAAGRANWAARGGMAGSSFYPAGNAAGAFGQDCPVDPGSGRLVEFVVHAKMEPNYVNEDTSVSLEFLGGGGEPLGSVATNVYGYLSAARNQWVPVRLRTSELPDETTVIRVRIAYDNGMVPDGKALATCQWDDARLVQAQDEAGLTAAPSPSVAKQDAVGKAIAEEEEPAPADAPSPAILPGNLAPNAGFEKAGEKGVPEGWTAFGNLGQRIAVTNGRARTGGSCLTMKALVRPGAFQGVYCNLPVEAGADYSFLVFATADREDRLAGSAHGQLMIEWMDKDGLELGKEASPAWTHNLSRMRWEVLRIDRVRAPKGAVAARFGIHWSDGQQKASGGILVDDVCVLKE